MKKTIVTQRLATALLRFWNQKAAAIVVICGLSMSASAQEYYETKHEVAISTGAITNTQLLDALSQFASILVTAPISAIVTGGQATAYYTYENEKNFPPLSAEYFYHVDKLVGVGGIVSFNSLKRDMYCDIQDASGNKKHTKQGVARMNNFTIMPAVKLDWLRKRNFGMYTKLGVGATIGSEKQKDDSGSVLYDDTDVMFNFQASLLGIEAGSTKIRGFIELGIGEQGMFVGGLRCKF